MHMMVLQYQNPSLGRGQADKGAIMELKQFYERII